MVLGEALVLSALGAALGVLLAVAATSAGMTKWVECNLGAFLPHFSIEARTAALVTAATIAATLVAAGLPASKIGRLRITDALRHIG